MFDAAGTFARVANIIDALPYGQKDSEPLRNVLPGLWPTVGDVRKLRDFLKANGWQP